MTTEEIRTQRQSRIVQTIQLAEPDRVPFVPIINDFYVSGYGISPYDAMMDGTNIIPGITKYIAEYTPDSLNIPGMYSIPTLESMQPTFLKWPGSFNLSKESPYQHIDNTWMEDDEYDEFIQDPTHFIMTKLLARKHKNLSGLSKIFLRDVYDMTFFNGLTQFADPEVQSALNTLMEAGNNQLRRAKQNRQLIDSALNAGCAPIAQGIMTVAFDSFADSVRGLIQAVEDTAEYPDELLAAVNLVDEMNTERNVLALKKAGARRVFIPLHCGAGMFMSDAAFRKFYWPGLKHCIDLCVKHDIVPILHCQGDYNSRLELLSQVPKGKVVYAFQNIDLALAKKTVGQVACIMGSMPSTNLAFGNPQSVIDEAKRQIDICAPGGGYIMSCTSMLDNAEHDLVRAWRDTVFEYGKY